MGHRCVHCGKMYPDGAKELLTGCSCGSRFFYFIKNEFIEKGNKKIQEDIQIKIEEMNKFDKVKMESDVRDIIGIAEQEEIPVILDLESIRVLGPGKFELDIVNLFNKKRPLIYKLEEGKYIIDLASTLKLNVREADKLHKSLKKDKSK